MRLEFSAPVVHVESLHGKRRSFCGERSGKLQTHPRHVSALNLRLDSGCNPDSQLQNRRSDAFGEVTLPRRVTALYCTAVANGEHDLAGFSWST